MDLNEAAGSDPELAARIAELVRQRDAEKAIKVVRAAVPRVYFHEVHHTPRVDEVLRVWGGAGWYNCTVLKIVNGGCVCNCRGELIFVQSDAPERNVSAAEAKAWGLADEYPI